MSVDVILCPVCDEEQPIQFDTFVEEGETISCRQNHRFNVFTIYEGFYQEIPIAKRTADSITRALYSNYEIDPNGASRTEISTIMNWLGENNFESIFPKIVLETVKFGNAMLSFDSQFRISKVELPFASIRVGTTKGLGDASRTKIQQVQI